MIKIKGIFFLINIPHSNLGLPKALGYEIDLLKGGDETLLSACHFRIERQDFGAA